MSEEQPENLPARADEAPTRNDLRSGRFSTRGGPKPPAKAPVANTPGQEPPARRRLSREQAEAMYQRFTEEQRKNKQQSE